MSVLVRSSSVRPCTFLQVWPSIDRPCTFKFVRFRPASNVPDRPASPTVQRPAMSLLNRRLFFSSSFCLFFVGFCSFVRRSSSFYLFLYVCPASFYVRLFLLFFVRSFVRSADSIRMTNVYGLGLSRSVKSKKQFKRAEAAQSGIDCLRPRIVLNWKFGVVIWLYWV